MNIKWPNSMISNKTFYARCRTKPLSSIAEAARWKMLGHVLRSDESSPAHASLCFAVDSMGILNGRIGRHRINLFKVLQNDLKQRSIPLTRYEDKTMEKYVVNVYFVYLCVLMRARYSDILWTLFYIL